MDNIIIKKDKVTFVSNDFIRSSELSLTEKGLYIILAGYCKEGEKYCSPSIRADLVKATGVTPKTIINTLKKLEEKGYIKIEEQVNISGGRLPNRYVFLDKDYSTEFDKICEELKESLSIDASTFDRVLYKVQAYIQKSLPNEKIFINGANYQPEYNYTFISLDLATDIPNDSREWTILKQIIDGIEDNGVKVFMRELTRPPYTE